MEEDVPHLRRGGILFENRGAINISPRWGCVGLRWSPIVIAMNLFDLVVAAPLNSKSPATPLTAGVQRAVPIATNMPVRKVKARGMYDMLQLVDGGVNSK